ncbi:DUF3137 domain-containing protein [Echinicola shivajiensis]|uniref:DUF3137 domain-containing protein n=1 Tax=Echinicola shivajiensis TaxID=1035916 RepID=UPI001BFC7FC6|nr:DUF3137 domain-containing protein [Echinicola shivajiensis]
MQARIQNTYIATSKSLAQLYRKRKRSLFYQKVLWSITALYIIAMLIIFGLNYFANTPAFLKPFQVSPNNPYINVYLLSGLVLLLYPSSLGFAQAFKNFKIKENETMVNMVNNLFPEVEFSQGLIAPNKEIIKSKLFSWLKKESPMYSFGQIRSHSRDLQINIADIGIVENNASNQLLGALLQIPLLNMFVLLYQYVLKNMVSNSSVDNHTFTFRGMFCWLKFKKKLNGHTVVIPNNTCTKLNRLISYNFTEEQRIRLEDPRFAEQFLVYSTDQIEARYVLSASLMERIVTLKEKFNQPILLSFQHQQLFLAVENEHGLFSFPSGKLDDLKIVEELTHDIQTGLQIASELNLKAV